MKSISEFIKRSDTVYKIVTKDNHSAIIPPVKRYKKYCLKYDLNKRTYAVKNTLGIFCFKDIVSVQSFLFTRRNMLLPYKILECKGYDLKPSPKEISSVLYATYLNDYYKNYIGPTIPLPEGTLLYESIEPIKEIQL